MKITLRGTTVGLVEQLEQAEPATKELSEMWGGRMPTWEEFKSAHRQGSVRTNKRLALRAVWNPGVSKFRVFLYFLVVPSVSFLVIPATIALCFVWRVSYWWILASVVIVPYLLNFSVSRTCEAVKDGAADNEQLYSTLLYWGGFLFAPEETGGGTPYHKIKEGLSWDRESLSRLMMKSFFPLALVFVFALIQLIRFGNVHDYLFMVIGSCLSVAAIFGYGLIPMLDRGKKSWTLSFFALAGSIPYTFSCYLVFYRGFWRVKDLFTHFSVGGLMVRMVFVLLGWRILNGFWVLTEFVKKAERPGCHQIMTERKP